MPAGPVALVVPMSRVLRVVGAGTLLALPLAAVAGWLLAGSSGAWGALLGIALPAAFLGVTAALALLTATMDARRMTALLVGSWVVKVLALVAVLGVLRDLDGWSRPAFLVAFAVGVAGWLAAECVVVLRTRVPYVEPVTETAADRL
ncbi:MAG TPA: hypothetical protein VK894_01265 [Jiangellales bacterium]|nr:hypothetical protein [Jiangellales bacterium]